jgi:hypothetical protein
MSMVIIDEFDKKSGFCRERANALEAKSEKHVSLSLFMSEAHQTCQ